MFGAKYSRLKFWIISLCLLFPSVFMKLIAKALENGINNNAAALLYMIISIISFIWINTLANRIRDYGSNPWLSLIAIIPIVNIAFAFYYGIKKYKVVSEIKE